jgi:succinate dehydrogenase/fumarate reductase cytochrome b subunit
MITWTGRPDSVESDNAHRQLIGYIGLVLPLLLILIALKRDGLAQWRNLESISAYYYTGAVAAFVGMLVALALFLFTYRGYPNKYNWADRGAAKIAAIAAVVDAFFPTKAPDGVPALAWWTPGTGILHHAAAVVLFTMFAIFALWLFRLTADGAPPDHDKRLRNHVYLGCGLAIVACIAWAGLDGLHDRPIFWPESVALVAFALSWLVKGYALRTLAGTARALLGSQAR